MGSVMPMPRGGATSCSCNFPAFSLSDRTSNSAIAAKQRGVSVAQWLVDNFMNHAHLEMMLEQG